MKLGLRPFVRKPTDLYFHKYRTGAPLPKHPAIFGHQNLISDWKMLGNDVAGDCYWAGSAHEVMLLNAAAGRTVAFTDECVLSDYAACTGFNLNDPNSDQGTDLQQGADYRMKTGIVDANGNRHKIGAYVLIQPIYEDFLDAVWLFGVVGLGIQFPKSAMDQFYAGQPWTVVPDSPIDGGHYIPTVGDQRMPEVVTWAKIQQMDARFWRANFMVGIAYISEDQMASGKSPEGFDLSQLQADLNQLPIQTP